MNVLFLSVSPNFSRHSTHHVLPSKHLHQLFHQAPVAVVVLLITSNLCANQNLWNSKSMSVTIECIGHHF